MPDPSDKNIRGQVVLKPFWRRRRLAVAWIATAGLGVIGAIFLFGLEPSSPRFSDAIGLVLCVITFVFVFLHIVLDDKARRKFVARVADDEYRVCPQCGYLLSGLPDQGKCPECGRGYSIEELERIWRPWRY